MLQHLLADHAAGAGAAAGVRAARPPHGHPAGPARARGGQPQLDDEHADDRAVLRPGRHAGQALRPPGRASRPSSRPRARRVRDIGVRTAMVQWVFVTALTLVSALALALVYGLGGFYALRGSLDAGAVVALALLLTRLYAPLTALASARVEVMSALVSFERVFEVLDLEPLIQRAGRAAAAARRAGVGRVRRRARSPTRRPTRSRWPRSRRSRSSTPAAGSRCCTTCRSRAEPGQMVALVGSSGAGKSTIAQLLPRLYDVDAGAVRLAGVDVRDLTAASIRETLGHGDPGRPPVPRVGPRQPAARPARRRPRRSCGTCCAAPGSPTWSRALPDGLDTVVGERGYRLSGGERQRLTIARLLLARPRVVDPRRGDRPPGLDVGGGGAGGARRGARRAAPPW